MERPVVLSLCVGLALAAVAEGATAPTSSSFLSAKSVITVLLLVAAFLFWRSRRERVPLDKQPVLIGGLPFIGAGKEYFENPEKFLIECWKKQGDIFSLWLVGHRMTFLCGDKGAELFFHAEEHQFSSAEAYKFMIPVFGGGVIFDVEQPIMAQQKRFVKHSFTPARFEKYIPLFQEEVNSYFDEFWGDEGVGDLLEAFNEVTVFTSIRSLQGEEVRAALKRDFASLYADLDASLTPIGFFFPNLPLPGTFRRDKARAKVGQLYGDILRKRRENQAKGIPLPDDIMTSFMESVYSDGRATTDDEVTGLLIALLVAGQHTSNTTGAWTGIYILQNQEYLKRVLDEQADMFHGEEPTLVGLKKCSVLENAIKETLRLRPPLVMLMRKVLEDVEFEGKTLAAGTLVCCSPLMQHRLPSMWKDPETWNPDRFVGEDAEDKKFRWNYFPFGGGRHQCSGQKFGYHQIRTIWTTLFNRYELELVTPMETIKPNYSQVIAGPYGPIQVRYKRRTVPLHHQYGAQPAQ